jgi:hypothetical protein
MTETTKPVTHAKIGAALAAAQAEMGPAVRDAKNPAFNKKYADLSAVTAACMPALNKHGIAVIQPPGSEGNDRWVSTVFIHGASGETLECRVPLIIGKNDMQGYGSAVTYARRYGLMCMAGIAPEDDDGNQAVTAAPKADDARNSNDAYEAQVAAAIRSIRKEDTLESLGAYWADMSKREKHVAADPHVIKAKDARKGELAPKAGPDVGDGENGIGG